MPICRKCEKYFPNRLKINNKFRILNRRKYCLECSPWKSHNTKQLHIVQLIAQPMCVCSICGRNYIYSRAKGGTKNKCNACLTNNRRYKIKIKSLEYKGNKCQICGYDKCIQSLCFHHLYDKDFIISGSHCRKWETIQMELDKCILVCANCHGEIHFGLITIEFNKK